jgi:hypothetical protein
MELPTDWLKSSSKASVNDRDCHRRALVRWGRRHCEGRSRKPKLSFQEVTNRHANCLTPGGIGSPLNQGVKPFHVRLRQLYRNKVKTYYPGHTLAVTVPHVIKTFPGKDISLPLFHTLRTRKTLLRRGSRRTPISPKSTTREW